MQTLSIGGNPLKVLPPEIGNLTSLKELSLWGTPIKFLPIEIAKLTKLSELDLRSSQLRELPIEINQLTNLRKIDLDSSLIVFPPPEIVSQGTKAILSFLSEHLQSQWVSKLLIVGQGGVGKTQLLRCLRGETFDPQLSTTHGIDVQSLDLVHPSKKDTIMHLNAWDFGGQEIYHATHQFFLTNRSLFLLVWNARHGFEQGKLFYWLDAIQARAPESPVIIVATQIDERDPDLPFEEIRTKYRQVVGQWAVSNLTGKGIAELKQAITKIAALLPLMGELWPKPWLEAANYIRARPKKYVSPQELSKIMKGHGVKKESSPVLAKWLHELGDILYFQEDEELQDIVILQPQWVSGYISKVVDDAMVIRDAGIFTRKEMNKLWSDLTPSLRDHFLRLMEKFDLSYRTLENKEVSLVVERLPLDPPDYEKEWEAAKLIDSSHDISIKFHLNTIPPGIPTWFIARSHRFTTHKHWRYGAIFQHEKESPHLALVQASSHDRIVQLTVRGANPHNFFALLKDGFEVTLERYPGLEIERTIPCPGHNGKPCKHEFNYEQLIKRLEKKPFIECPEALEDVDVRTLLFGLTPATIDQVLYEVQKSAGENKVRHDELVALLQREFIKNFRREQAVVDSYCPNIFVLRPLEAGGWKKALVGEKVELQLYCQQPGCWHPTEKGGRYQISRPIEWLKNVGPYLKAMMTMLKYVSPFVGPWIGIADVAYKKLIENDLSFMNELIRVMPDLIDSHELDLARKTREVGDINEPDHVHGAALRALRQLLDEVDKSQNWGGLERAFTPEGHYLWLCEFHAKEYKI